MLNNKTELLETELVKYNINTVSNGIFIMSGLLIVGKTALGLPKCTKNVHI